MKRIALIVLFCLLSNVSVGQSMGSEFEFIALKAGAESGNANDQHELGKWYDYGWTGNTDRIEAVKWYRKAAEQGHAEAQNRLGKIFELGLSVQQNYSEAMKWYRKAAEQGNAHAQFELGVLYDTGQGVPENWVEAAKWFRKSAEQGHTGAQNNLGIKYADGKGVPQNFAEAYIWSSVAATSGDQVAIDHRDIYASKLSPDTLSAAQQHAARLYEEIEAGTANTQSFQISPSPVPVELVVKSSGTCFFIDSFGTAVTNNHVISGSSTIEVIAANGSKSSATLIKTSSILDVAVLATGHQTPQFLTLAENDSLALGQDVFTIGFPVTNLLGDKPKYSEGTISALSGLNNDDSWIQMSTPIQPGNSGGPLVDLNGQVVGVVTATAAVEKFFSVTGSLPQNINWAIKVEYARALIPETSTHTRFSNKQEAIAHTEQSVCRVIAR